MKRFLQSVAFFMTITGLSYSQDTIKFELVKDIYKGKINENSSFIRYLTPFNNKFIFTAQGDLTGIEMYISDGTSAGTHLIKNINAYHWNMTSDQDNGSDPEGMTVFGDKIIFCANDDIHGYEPWITDGTAIGTHLIKDMLPPGYSGNNGSNPRGFTEYHDKIYFAADIGPGGELYCTDGTEPGTYQVKDIDGFSAWPMGFIVFHDKLFFTATDFLGSELWISDGTDNGTKVLKDINTGIQGSGPGYFTEYNNKLYFAAFIDSMGRELWETDGTEPGTKLCRDINTKENAGSNPGQFTILNDRLYFIASDSSRGLQLWCTNGDSVFMVKSISPDPTAIMMGYTEMHVFNNRLYFGAMINAMSNFTLWTSDGTPEGTFELLASDSTFISDPQCFVNWHNQMIFMGKKQYTGNNQLWITDGTWQNTRRIFNDSITGWSPIKSIAPFTLGGDAFFVAQFVDSIGAELYKLVIDTIVDFPVNDPDYTHFDTTHVNWNEFYESGDWGPDNILFSEYFISGDTLIDNLKYFKIYTSSDNDSIYVGAFRENNKVVLYNGLDYWGFNTDTSVVLYDFTKNEGDTVHTGTYQQSVIVEIDSIAISGGFRKRYKMEDGQYWIEGIGSTRGFLFPMTAIPTMYWHSELVCFKHMGNMIYLNPGFTDCTTRIVTSISDLKTDDIEMFPNPVERGQDIIIKSSNIQIAKVQLFDQSGTLVSSIHISQMNTVHINSKDYEPGFYIALVMGANGEVYKRKIAIK